MESPAISITYMRTVRDRPAPAVFVRAAAGDPRRGWLSFDDQTANRVEFFGAPMLKAA